MLPVKCYGRAGSNRGVVTENSRVFSHFYKVETNSSWRILMLSWSGHLHFYTTHERFLKGKGRVTAVYRTRTCFRYEVVSTGIVQLLQPECSISLRKNLCRQPPKRHRPISMQY